MTLPSETTYTPPTFQSSHGRNTHIFQPPHSPAPSTATPTDYFSTRSLKRRRPDSSHDQDRDTSLQTPWAATPSWVQCPTPSDGVYMSSCAPSSALVNEKYRLAGGFDTPGLLATSENERHDERDFRRCVRDKDMEFNQGREGGNAAQISGPLARERNGAARISSSPNGDQLSGTWTGLAFSLVGKVFTFGTSVIKGFYAGGGKGYDIDQQTSLADSWMPSARRLRVSTPVPGSWLNSDDFLGDFEQDNPNSPTRPQVRIPNKRRQTDKDSWVLVGTPEETVDSSPKRKPSSNSVPRPSLPVRPTASKANSRRSLAPVSRRQSAFVSHSGSPFQPGPHQPPTAIQETPQLHNKRASIAGMRISNSRPNSSHSRPSSSGGGGGTQYITPEAERLLKRQAKQDKAADKAMSSMSRRLEDLIRQGQEALGTKFSVEGEDVDMETDEGFVDEEW